MNRVETDFLIIGSGIGGLHEIEEQCTKLFEKGPDRVSPFVVPKMMLNAAGGNLSIRYGLRGINYSVATACASANNALGDAMQAIQRGVADSCARLGNARFVIRFFRCVRSNRGANGRGRRQC